MGLTLTVYVGVDTYVMQSNGFPIIGYEGVGAPLSERYETRGVQQHGVTDHGFALLSRVFSLIFPNHGTIIENGEQSFTDMWSIRSTLGRIFPRTQDPLRLRFDFDTGESYEIAAHVIDGPVFSSANVSGYVERVPVTFRAGSPLFYNPVMQLVDFGISAGGGSLLVPVEVPVSVGQSTINDVKVVDYPGTFETNPILYVYGPITQPAIVNETTGETIAWRTGVTIPAGEYRVIDTRYEHKSVVDQAGARKFSEITEDSDIGTFHLARKPEAPDGRNSVRVTGTNANANTKVRLQYYEQFELLGGKN